jgi:hypothetical protein
MTTDNRMTRDLILEVFDGLERHGYTSPATSTPAWPAG